MKNALAAWQERFFVVVRTVGARTIVLFGLSQS